MGSTTCWMLFIPSRVLTNCHIWLMGVEKVTNNCQINKLKWWFIDIQSILPIDHQKNQYNRTIINHITASDKFDSQRRHIDKQTNRRRRWSLIYNKKNILISPQTRLLIYTENLYLHTLHRYKIQTHNTGPPPVAPRRQYTYTQHIRTNAQTRVSIFHVSIFWEKEAD